MGELYMLMTGWVVVANTNRALAGIKAFWSDSPGDRMVEGRWEANKAGGRARGEAQGPEYMSESSRTREAAMTTCLTSHALGFRGGGYRGYKGCTAQGGRKACSRPPPRKQVPTLPGGKRKRK